MDCLRLQPCQQPLECKRTISSNSPRRCIVHLAINYSSSFPNATTLDARLFILLVNPWAPDAAPGSCGGKESSCNLVTAPYIISNCS